MKLKRFVAKDMRAALTLVKEELGADAIIMSNKRIAAGVEIVAGVESLPTKTAPQQNATLPAGNIIKSQPEQVHPVIGDPQTRHDRRLIGGKNQAYAKSLIEILERQKSMSKAQGDQLLNNIDRQNQDAAAPQPRVPQRPQQRPAVAQAQQQRPAPQAAVRQTSTRPAQVSSSASSVQADDLKRAFKQGLANQKQQQEAFKASPMYGAFPGAQLQDGRGQMKSGPAVQPLTPVNPVFNGDEEDDMANDPNKRAGPSRIDPSLEEDADLFKTPPLPLSQQREFKNFFVKSKVKQEKEAFESRDGIDSYRQPADANMRQDLEKMRSEVENIRKLLQFELAGLLQDNRSRNEPVKAMIFKLFHSMGFSDNVAEALVHKLPPETTFNSAWREVVSILERAILVGDDEIISRGGIVTLIGPAGVGKTTTLAKLAARFVMRYGPQRVAIVTADHYRIGAVEQIKTYGRIMGCATYAVKSLSELPQLLYSLSDKSLILVDTAGVGFRDERFSSQLSQLKLQASLKLKHYLVLPCTAQRRVLQHAYDHFSVVGLSGLILTKIDECQNLGDALSLCIEMKLPISYITDGQRVPEDIDVPHPNALARRALSSVEDDAVQSALGNSGPQV